MMFVVVLLAVLVAVLAAVVTVLVRRVASAPDPGVAAAQATQHARQVARAQSREQATAERDAAVQAALHQAAVLQREMAGSQAASAQQQLAAVLDAGREQLAALAASTQQELGAKKDVIDARLDQMAGHLRAELGRVAEQVQQLGKASSQSFGQVAAALTAHTETTQALSSTAQGLREALASPKARGQWGERMAEDVLRLAGFVENVNYRKQTKVAGGEGLPDFTFELPKGQVLYLDVKFPMSAYLRYLEAGTDAERSAHRDTFVRDVRLRVRELAKRDYARQGDRPSVDYVLLFLPNETVSTFIHESDGAIIDEALRQKVVLCSPLTLFAMLGVIRQAHENFLIERTSDEILKVLGSFEQQWGKFTAQMEKVGRSIESTQRAFDELNGPRRRRLERPMAQIEDLRASRGIELDPPEEGEVLTLGLRELGA
jgi:DNA recombination protein RmuC